MEFLDPLKNCFLLLDPRKELLSTNLHEWHMYTLFNINMSDNWIAALRKGVLCKKKIIWEK